MEVANRQEEAKEGADTRGLADPFTYCTAVRSQSFGAAISKPPRLD